MNKIEIETGRERIQKMRQPDEEGRWREGAGSCREMMKVEGILETN